MTNNPNYAHLMLSLELQFVREERDHWKRLALELMEHIRLQNLSLSLSLSELIHLRNSSGSTHD